MATRRGQTGPRCPTSVLVVIATAVCVLGLTDGTTMLPGGHRGKADETIDYCEAVLQASDLDPRTRDGDLTLAMAVVVARHGDRTPVNVLPDEGELSWNGCGEKRTDTIPSSKAAFGGFDYAQLPASHPYVRGMWTGDCADGQLTPKGQRQHASLGASLRARWIERFSLIPPDAPAASLLSLRSTDIPRTRESAEHMITALLPKGVADGGSIPLTRRPWLLEDMVGNSKRCPRFKERMDELRRTPEWQAREAGRTELRRTLDAVLGTASEALYGRNPSMEHYFDALRTRSCNGKSLPCNADLHACHELQHKLGGTCCITKEVARQVFAEGDWEYATVFSDSELARLAVGAFLYELWQDIQAAGAGQAPYKLGVRLGHDTTVSPLLGALGAPAHYWVPYASHVEMEVWRSGANKSAAEVHVFFNGESLKLPQCSGTRQTAGGGKGGGSAGGILFYCTLAEFEAIAAPGEPKAFAEACRPKDSSAALSGQFLAGGDKYRWNVLVGVAVLCLCVVLLGGRAAMAQWGSSTNVVVLWKVLSACWQTVRSWFDKSSRQTGRFSPTNRLRDLDVLVQKQGV